MLRDVLTFAEDAVAADNAEGVCAAFHGALASHGLSYLQVRRYRRPRGALTSAKHWQAGGFVSRHVVPGWIGSASHAYICFEQNPLLEPIARGVTRYRFSDYAPFADRRFGRYWEAMGEGGIADALCASAYGRDRGIASLHIGFGARDLAPDFAEAVQTAGSIVAERLLRFAMPANDDAPAELSPRERDAIAYVAEGKTDWEIGRILGVSEATARFHVDNARKKLGAVNRAHAVARFIAETGPF